MTTDRSYYEILQVDSNAEADVIAAAYRRLAQKYHPDATNDPSAAEGMKELNEAFEVLGDPEKRKAYDQEKGFSRSAAEGESEPSAAHPTRYRDAQPTVRQGASPTVVAAFLVALAALAIGAIIFVVVLAANGDDGGDSNGGQPLTLEEYFARIDEIFKAADKDTTDLQDTFDADLANAAGFDEEVDLLQTFLDGTIEAFNTAVDDMQAITPPQGAQESHVAFVQAARDSVSAAQDLRNRLDEAQSKDDLDRILSDFESESSVTLRRLDNACLGLQDIADTNGIDVDLLCEQ
jgi:curved DNA-binding protein CbpA